MQQAQASQQVWTSWPGGIGFPVGIPLKGGKKKTRKGRKASKKTRKGRKVGGFSLFGKKNKSQYNILTNAVIDLREQIAKAKKDLLKAKNDMMKINYEMLIKQLEEKLDAAQDKLTMHNRRSTANQALHTAVKGPGSAWEEYMRTATKTNPNNVETIKKPKV